MKSLQQCNCDNCGKPFKLSKVAPHKRFCTSRCRMEWHAKQRQRALDLLRAQEELAPESLKTEAK